MQSIFQMRFVAKISSNLVARTHEQHFTRYTAWGAGEQLTITANHHHHGAPLTIALMSGKRTFGLMCCARQLQGCRIASVQGVIMINNVIQLFFSRNEYSSYFYIGYKFDLHILYYNCHNTPSFVRHGSL